MENNFYFKGNRNYIHPSTLFDHIINKYVSGNYIPENIDFSMNRITDRNCLITPNRNERPSDNEVGKYKDNVSQLYIFATEKIITKRVPFNEEEITGRCTIKNSEIIIPADITNYTFMEKVIIAYKSILLSLYGETYGKYIFARMQLNHLPQGEISIKQSRIISKRFFEGTIMQHHNEIGKIFYGVQKK